MTPLSVLKWLGGPGSIGFLALCCAIGLVLRVRGRASLGRAWLLTVYAGYVIAGLPIVATSLGAAVSPYRPIEDLAGLRSTDALIVLHGDNVRGRLHEARRIFEATGGPVVLVLGDHAFRESLVAGGIPDDRLASYVSPGNTRSQIQEVARFVRERHPTRPVLVASRVQMPRIAALLRSERVAVALAPSPIDDEPPVRGAWQWVPMYKALRLTRDALYESIALRYYRHSGWID